MTNMQISRGKQCKTISVGHVHINKALFSYAGIQCTKTKNKAIMYMLTILLNFLHSLLCTDI